MGYSRFINQINPQDLNKLDIEEVEIPFVDKVESLRILMIKILQATLCG